MPIDPDGEKWACEPCIRGHRSTKCEHFDRFMMRVKRPGRPLSKCPHPKGKCSCAQEKVLMVRIPRDGLCLCEPAANVPPMVIMEGMAYSITTSPGPKSKIQKAGQRPGSVGFSTNVAQAISRHNSGGRQEILSWLPPNSQNGDNKIHVDPEHDALDRKPRLQLGMMGVGGVRAKDEVGWEGSWPSLGNGHVQEHSEVKKPVNGCCSSAPKSAKPANAPGPCCGSGGQESISDISPANHIPSGVVVGFPRPILDRQGSIQAHDHRQGWPADMTATAHHGIAPMQLQQGVPVYPNPSPIPLFSNPPVHTFSHPTQTMPGSATSFQDPSGSRHGSLHPQTMSTTNGVDPQDGPMLACNCGDQCQCFGCAVHPGNDTTRTRLQELNQLMIDFEEDSEGSRSRSNAALDRNGNGLAHQTTQGYNLYASSPPTMDATFANGGQHFQNGLGSTLGFFDPSQDQAMYQNVQSNSDMSFDQEQAIMRPSAYITMEYPFQAWGTFCTDFTGSCRCGDDCACDGCLTHSGHTGVQNGNSLDLQGAHVHENGSKLKVESPDLQPVSMTNIAFQHSHFQRD